MRYVVLLILLLPGCKSVSKETVRNIRNQHVIYREFSKRMDEGKTNRQQEQQMIRNAALTYQALDREITNWKPDKTLSEVDIDKPDR